MKTRKDYKSLSDSVLQTDLDWIKSADFYECSLSPKELVEAKKRILDQQGDYFKEVKKLFNDIKLDEVSQELFRKSLVQLEIINKATEKKYSKTLNLVDQNAKTLKVGESKTWDFDYKDVNGNKKHLWLGIEQKEKIISSANLNIDTHEEKINTITKPYLKYYKMEYDPKTQSFTKKDYISKKHFEELISEYSRCNTKNEFGIGEELYTMTASDGSRFVITDSRDDSFIDPLTGKSANSFKDGFENLNMYKITPDGQNIQMTAKDVTDMVEQNGITMGDINSRNAGGKSLNIKPGEVIKNVGHGAKTFIRDFHGMDASTTTRV